MSFSFAQFHVHRSMIKANLSRFVKSTLTRAVLVLFFLYNPIAGRWKSSWRPTRRNWPRTSGCALCRAKSSRAPTLCASTSSTSTARRSTRCARTSGPSTTPCGTRSGRSCPRIRATARPERGPRPSARNRPAATPLADPPEPTGSFNWPSLRLTEASYWTTDFLWFEARVWTRHIYWLPT